MKVLNEIVTNTLHGTKCLTVGTDLYSNELASVSTTEYPSLFTLVSTSIHPTSIATTGIRSDAPYKHALYQGWNIEKYSTPMERSDWSILCVNVINIYIY